MHVCMYMQTVVHDKSVRVGWGRATYKVGIVYEYEKSRHRPMLYECVAPRADAESVPNPNVLYEQCRYMHSRPGARARISNRCAILILSHVKIAPFELDRIDSDVFRACDSSAHRRPRSRRPLAQNDAMNVSSPFHMACIDQEKQIMSLERDRDADV